MPHPLCEAALTIGKDVIGLLDGVHAHPNERARVATALASTISELFVATLTLLDSGSSHAMTLTRSMLEAQVDLTLLGADPSHLRQMRFDDARQFITVYNGFQAVIGDGTFGPQNVQHDLPGESRSIHNLETAPGETDLDSQSQGLWG